MPSLLDRAAHTDFGLAGRGFVIEIGEQWPGHPAIPLLPRRRVAADWWPGVTTATAPRLGSTAISRSLG